MKTTPRQLATNLADLAESLRRRIEAEVAGFDPDPAAVTDRQAQADRDFRFFAVTYFPHYLKHDPSVLHDWLFERLQRIGTPGEKGMRLAVAAPRGEAKSTLVTLIFVLWCVLTNRRRFVPIITDAFEQAVAMLEAIKAELTANPRLRQDFPAGFGEGRTWKEGVIVTTNNARIQAFGSGKRMRGLRHGPYRPDLTIGDDLENDENVRSPEQREKLEGWLTRSVLSLGAADDSMDVVVIGTILHYDSVLARLLRNPLWEGRVFRALIEWPSRMDLWERWEEVLRNDGEELADAFYRERAWVMDVGAVISWPAARSLVGLMKKRVRDGRAAFDSEQQNDPINTEHALFGKIQYWSLLPPNLTYFGAVDPSLGRLGNARDPSAILVGGMDRDAGILYVMEALIAKRVPDLIIEEVIRLQRQHHCVAWAVEAVQFQEFFRTELLKRSVQQGVPVSARAVIPITDKMLRIEALQPFVADGRIRFHASQIVLLQQLRHYPMDAHDDGPDALQMLWMLAASSFQLSDFRSNGQLRPGATAPTVNNIGWGAVGGGPNMRGF